MLMTAGGEEGSDDPAFLETGPRQGKNRLRGSPYLENRPFLHGPSYLAGSAGLLAPAAGGYGLRLAAGGGVALAWSNSARPARHLRVSYILFVLRSIQLPSL